MLNFKQKSKAFRELNSPEASATDLQQLRDAGFDTKKCDLYARNPKRYGNDIINHLLDLKTQSEIILNRRKAIRETEAPENVETPCIASPLHTPAPNAPNVPNVPIEAALKAKQEAEEKAKELQAEVESLQQDNETLQEEADDLSTEKEDLETALEEEQAAHEETKATLDAEKKKAPASSKNKSPSKSTKNTPT
jgi:hypothetical protein